MACVVFAFVGLAARAAWVQVIDNDFFLRQGEVRFARTLELSANRGRILDRNGLILASSVPAASIWSIPEDVEKNSPEDLAKLPQLAKLMDMPLDQLKKKLAEDKKLRLAQAPAGLGRGYADQGLGHQGHLPVCEKYKRQYPEGEAAAHVVGFTNVEDKGQEGMELAFEKGAWRARRARAG